MSLLTFETVGYVFHGKVYGFGCYAENQLQKEIMKSVKLPCTELKIHVINSKEWGTVARYTGYGIIDMPVSPFINRENMEDLIEAIIEAAFPNWNFSLDYIAHSRNKTRVERLLEEYLTRTA